MRSASSARQAWAAACNQASGPAASGRVALSLSTWRSRAAAAAPSLGEAGGVLRREDGTDEAVIAVELRPGIA